MNTIMEIARTSGLKVIEDAAQSIGARHDDRAAGSIGDVGAFSAHPLKNLNAAGDAGFLVTDSDAVAEQSRLMRNHGLADRNTATLFSHVSRLDTVQAVILHHRLGSLDQVIARRRANAARYRELLDSNLVFIPPCRRIEFNTFHTFVIQVDHRDALQSYLAQKKIGTAIHYPIPIHLQPAAAYLGLGPGSFSVTERQAGRILTLPIHQHLKDAQIDRITSEVNHFLAAQRQNNDP